MNQMVTDLLDFTRTRFGDAMPVVAAGVNLEAVIRDVASEVRASHPGSVINLAFTGDLKGHWDSARLSQALINIVGNAVQHGLVETPVTVGAERDNGEVRIRVHNSGTPIAPEAMAQLFEPMKEMGRGGSGDRRHLGLGLFIVDKIVRAHGGRIEVQSTRDAGTTFIMHLPVRGVN
jgi:signal transduction histidine kinase